MFATFKRYGWIAVLVILLIVGGAAWYEYDRSRETAQARAFGDAILAALEQGEPLERATALSAIEAGTPDARAVRDMLEAGERSTAGDREGALTLLTGVAENPELQLIYRSLAKFRALALSTDDMGPAERRAEYEDLAGAGSPLRLLAKEQIAVTHIEEGNRDEALRQLNAMLDEAGMTQDLLRRVSQLIVSLGGTPGENGGADTE
ncbi:hypothetical protein OB2597_03749 [Pseudooceanicola batsensis HTCC2597]|uniref:Tetratricopeptide repeat-like domain-containing protein n=1 Tax=Pseudooceanicola batsensis (strain ATCC BAA-863 / DSM 15984 / KCTC 12145 / HTCC2597) TaxID=252305 RepID=A3U3T3_PSEBH|nr:hypothetical protein OB2597_03749 [Pseudooceanicola batsensis HTCC2597]